MFKKSISLTSNKDIFYILLIFFVAIFAFWQISFLQNVLKWDFLSITFPWRYFIGENIRQGLIPLWSPYAKLGFPLYFDPQTWYPVSWLISIFFEYSIYTVHLEFILHIFLSGVGVYYFSQHFISNKKYRLLSAIIVMLSGFSVGNAQHMGWIVSAAWIPFVFNSYLNIFKKKNFIPVLSSTLFLSLLFSGGYFPFFLTVIYVISLIFVSKAIFLYKNNDKLNVRNYILKNFVFAILFFLVNIVVILSLLEARKYIPRGLEITLERALGQSIEPKGLLTFIFPFLNIFGDSNFWGDEKTVMNSYFGFISFIILIFGLFLKKNKQQKLLLVLGAFAFMTAMAHVFPFRRIFYFILPFFKYFRFPSLFRYFGILAFAVFVGMSLKQIFEVKKYLRIFKYILFLVGLLLLSLIAFLSVKNGIFNTFEICFDNPKNLNFGQIILIQSSIDFIILILFLLSIVFIGNNKIRQIFALIFIVVDMIISVQLNAKETIIANFKPNDIHRNLKKLPKAFPYPDLNEKIINNNDKVAGLHPLWRNINYYYKKIAYNGYGPYQLNHFTTLERSVFFKQILNNNLFYFVQNIQNLNSIDTAFVQQNPSRIVITDDSLILSEKIDYPDSCSIKIVNFNPQNIELEIYSDKKSLLVFMQNYYPSWKVFVDGKEIKIHEVNFSLQGIIVEKGIHQVIYKFENNKIKIAALISAISFFLILVFALFLILRNKKEDFFNFND